MTDLSGKRLVSLPEINFYLHRVKLAPEAQILYDEVLGVLQGIIKGMMKKGTATAHYSNVRELNSRFGRWRWELIYLLRILGGPVVYLLRLRQLACDPSLCPQSFIDECVASSASRLL